MALLTNTEILNYLQAAQGITVPSSGQTLITMIQPLVEGEIKRILGSNVEEATYTEYYPEGELNSWIDGDSLVINYEAISGMAMARSRGERSLGTIRLRHLPVKSVGSVYENPAAWNTAGGDFPSGSLLATNAYALDLVNSSFSLTGKLYRTVGLWTVNPRCVKVTYTAGWTAGEIETYFPSVKMAALVSMAYHYGAAVARSKGAAAGGQVTSISIEGFSQSMDPAATGGFDGKNYGVPPEAAAMLAPFVNLSRYLGV